VAGTEGGAWQIAKNGEKGGGFAAPKRASMYKDRLRLLGLPKNNNVNNFLTGLELPYFIIWVCFVISHFP